MAIKSKNKKLLYLIDGMPLVYRAYYALINSPLFTSSGFNSSAVYGYVNTLLQIIDEVKSNHIVVVFDVSRSKRRITEYPEYKGNRQKTPEDILVSLPYVKRLTEALGVATFSLEDVEADDVIGTLTLMAEKKGFENYIITPDKDFAQLVSRRTFLYRLPRKNRDKPDVLDISKVIQMFGISKPDQVRDFISLVGDKVDNIPGVPGIGEKTAQKLIKKYDSLEGILKKIGELRGNQQETFKIYTEQALLSKSLATIDRNLSITITFDSFLKSPPDRQTAIELFNELEFDSLVSRVFGNADDLRGRTKQEDKLTNASNKKILNRTSYKVLQKQDDILGLLNILYQQKVIGLYVVCDNNHSKDANILGIAFSWEYNQASYVALPKNQKESELLLTKFYSFFENVDYSIIGHDLKRWVAIFRNYNCIVKNKLIDTKICHQLIENEGSHDFNRLIEQYLGYVLNPIEPEVYNEMSEREFAEYAGACADLTYRLFKELEVKINGLEEKEIWEEIEIPLLPLLINMESVGIKLDVSSLKKFSTKLEKEIDSKKIQISDVAGEDCNLNSPKQLGELLFDKLKIEKNPKKTRTGQYTTTEQELSRLKDRHTVIPLILNYRMLQKLKSTYVDPLPGFVSDETGRIHTTFNQLATATGRLTSESPNLQNIPIRSEEGREIRRSFIPSNSQNVLLSADYSQIELRVMASMTDDPGLTNAFLTSIDVHTATAAKVFGVSMEEVTAEMRRKSKMINFGLMYGMSAFGLSQRLNIFRGEAAEIINRYFQEFPYVKQFMDDTISFAKANGFVKTIKGRRRYLRDINSRNYSRRSASERIAINAPIQGSAADMIKIAMIKIHEKLIKLNLDTQMVLQIHDELVFEVPYPEIKLVKDLVVTEMSGAIDLGKIPIEVDVGFGNDWLEAH